MQLKNRIKRIEMLMGNPELCRCAETPKFETVFYESGKPATSPELIKDNSALIPDVCGLCGKPIQKTTLIVDFIESKIPKPTGAK